LHLDKNYQSSLKKKGDGRTTNKTVIEEVVAHVVWDNEKWGTKCKAHVEGVEDSTLLKGAIQDVGDRKDGYEINGETLNCSSGLKFSVRKRKKGRNMEEGRFKGL
jgi:hypothetical protein